MIFVVSLFVCVCDLFVSHVGDGEEEEKKNPKMQSSLTELKGRGKKQQRGTKCKEKEKTKKKKTAVKIRACFVCVRVPAGTRSSQTQLHNISETLIQFECKRPFRNAPCSCSWLLRKCRANNSAIAFQSDSTIALAVPL